MIFYIFTLFVLIYTVYILHIKQQTEELIVHVSQELRIPVHRRLTNEQKINCCESLKILKQYIREKHSLDTWFRKRFIYGVLFLVYCISPFISPLLGFDGFINLREDTQIKIIVWKTMIVIYLVGILVAFKVSIRKMRRRYLTQKEREVCS